MPSSICIAHSVFPSKQISSINCQCGTMQKKSNKIVQTSSCWPAKIILFYMKLIKLLRMRSSSWDRCRNNTPTTWFPIQVSNLSPTLLISLVMQDFQNHVGPILTPPWIFRFPPSTRLSRFYHLNVGTCLASSSICLLKIQILTSNSDWVITRGLFIDCFKQSCTRFLSSLISPLRCSCTHCSSLNCFN